MKKILIAPGNLLEMGFQKLKGDENFTGGYVEFNGEVLAGREITEQDINFLMELM